MIFGNPGVYDYDGKITYFAINVEKLFHAENNPPIIALNLLIKPHSQLEISNSN